MTRSDILNKKIEAHIKKEQLLRKEEYTKLEKPFLAKARRNFALANLQFKISDHEEIKKILGLASSFEVYDWVINVAYYAMYVAALAALAKLGFKSKSHAATIAVLEEFYVHRHRKLETKHINQLTKAYALNEELITKLIQIKTRRETAQYDATPIISKENALSSLADADEFITRIEDILL